MALMASRLKPLHLQVLGRSLSSLPNESRIVQRPFEDLPGLPKGWPLIGNFTMILQPHGAERMNQNVKEHMAKYDPEGVGMLRMESQIVNPIGNGRLVMLSRPEDFEAVFRSEGKTPLRGVKLFGGIEKWRETRPDLFGETTGVLLEEGWKWQNIRSKVQQDLMRPKSAIFYLDQLQNVADQFLERTEESLDKERVTPDDFLLLIHGFTFESISFVALDTRIGSLERDPDPEIARIAKAVRTAVDFAPDVIIGFPWWKISPLLSPSYRTIAKNLDIFGEFAKAKILEAKERIMKNIGDADKSSDKNYDVSVLEKLIIKCGPESSIPLVMAFDMIIAGIDTTGNSIAFLLYHLASNPEKQEILRNEILEQPEHLTEASLNKMKYLRAAIKESARLFPVVVTLSRIVPTEIDIRGYNFPANTQFFMPVDILGRDPKHFEDADKFVPERWLRENSSHYHAYSHIPFGHGPRMCIGKRFADLEMQIVICKLLRRYRMDWADEEPMQVRWRFVNAPTKGVKIRMNKLG